MRLIIPSDKTKVNARCVIYSKTLRFKGAPRTIKKNFRLAHCFRLTLESATLFNFYIFSIISLNYFVMVLVPYLTRFSANKRVVQLFHSYVLYRGRKLTKEGTFLLTLLSLIFLFV